MKVQQMWLDLRRHWMWVVVGAVLMAAIGAMLGNIGQASYISTTRVYLSTAAPSSDPEKLYAQYQITSARVQSQVELALSGEMRQAVSDALAERGSDAVPQSVVVTSPVGTVVIDIQVTADSPGHAQEVAAAYGQVLPEVIGDVEGGGSPITVNLIDEPAPGASATRGTLPNAIVGAALGAVLAAIVVVIVGQARRLQRSEPRRTKPTSTE